MSQTQLSLPPAAPPRPGPNPEIPASSAAIAGPENPEAELRRHALFLTAEIPVPHHRQIWIAAHGNKEPEQSWQAPFPLHQDRLRQEIQELMTRMILAAEGFLNHLLQATLPAPDPEDKKDPYRRCREWDSARVTYRMAGLGTKWLGPRPEGPFRRPPLRQMPAAGQARLRQPRMLLQSRFTALQSRLRQLEATQGENARKLLSRLQEWHTAAGRPQAVDPAAGLAALTALLQPEITWRPSPLPPPGDTQPAPAAGDTQEPGNWLRRCLAACREEQRRQQERERRQIYQDAWTRLQETKAWRHLPETPPPPARNDPHNLEPSPGPGPYLSPSPAAAGRPPRTPRTPRNQPERSAAAPMFELRIQCATLADAKNIQSRLLPDNAHQRAFILLDDGNAVYDLQRWYSDHLPEHPLMAELLEQGWEQVLWEDLPDADLEELSSLVELYSEGPDYLSPALHTEPHTPQGMLGLFGSWLIKPEFDDQVPAAE